MFLMASWQLSRSGIPSNNTILLILDEEAKLGVRVPSKQYEALGILLAARGAFYHGVYCRATDNGMVPSYPNSPTASQVPDRRPQTKRGMGGIIPRFPPTRSWDGRVERASGSLEPYVCSLGHWQLGKIALSDATMARIRRSSNMVGYQWPEKWATGGQLVGD